MSMPAAIFKDLKEREIQNALQQVRNRLIYTACKSTEKVIKESLNDIVPIIEHVQTSLKNEANKKAEEKN